MSKKGKSVAHSKPKRVRRRKASGLAPGVLVHTGDSHDAAIAIKIYSYNSAEIIEKSLNSIAEASAAVMPDRMNLISIVGLGNTGEISQIEAYFGFHAMALEDAVHTRQRSKLDIYGEQLVIILRQFGLIESAIVSQQITFLVKDNLIIVLQEAEHAVFTPVLERLHLGSGKLRNAGVDYLLYALMDAVVDSYFAVIDYVDEELERVDQGVLYDPRSEILAEIYNLKRQTLEMRRYVSPLRDVVNRIMKLDSHIVNVDNTIYLNDVLDHIIRTVEQLDLQRELLFELVNVYFSNVGSRTNEIMKALTILSAIFIPLTFIVGVYGMNFENMPAIHWEWGYVYVWTLMLSVTAMMIIYLRRRRWI